MRGTTTTTQAAGPWTLFRRQIIFPRHQYTILPFTLFDNHTNMMHHHNLHHNIGTPSRDQFFIQDMKANINHFRSRRIEGMMAQCSVTYFHY
jgi:hypothetical protein